MTIILEIIFIAILGAAFGSFANVLITRLPKDEPWIYSRSQCPNCKQQLQTADLIPIISFMLLRGKCRYCRKSIGWRYELCEIAAVLIFIITFKIYGLSLAFFKIIIFLFSMLILFFTDLEEQLIPDRISLPLIGIGIFLALIEHRFVNASLAILLGAGSLWLIGWVAEKFYKKPTIGLGDVKLIAGIGSFWGLKITFLSLYMGFIFGGLIGALLILVKRKKRTDYIAFAPFIILASIIAIAYSNILWGFLFGIK